MKIQYFKLIVLMGLIGVCIFHSCKRSNTSQSDEFKEYSFEGIQTGSFDSKLKDSNQNYHYRYWDTSYIDHMKVRMNITKKLIYFIFNKSAHQASPDTTEFVTTIQHNNYSIPLGYRVRYDFRFVNDSIFAEYFNLDGLTDTFYINKRLLFSGRRLD